MIKVRGKPQLKAVITANGPDASRINISFTSPGKDQWLAVELGENKKDMDCIAEEGSYKYQLQPCDQLQKWGL